MYTIVTWIVRKIHKKTNCNQSCSFLAKILIKSLSAVLCPKLTRGAYSAPLDPQYLYLGRTSKECEEGRWSCNVTVVIYSSRSLRLTVWFITIIISFCWHTISCWLVSCLITMRMSQQSALLAVIQKWLGRLTQLKSTVKLASSSSAAAAATTTWHSPRTDRDEWDVKQGKDIIGKTSVGSAQVDRAVTEDGRRRNGKGGWTECGIKWPIERDRKKEWRVAINTGSAVYPVCSRTW